MRNAVDFQTYGAAPAGIQAPLDNAAVFPAERDAISASQAKVPQLAFRPRRRKGWQQTDYAVVALCQHFQDSGSAAEIAVNLEGRVIVKEIGQGTLGQERLQMLPCRRAVLKPGIEIDDPGTAPPGVPTSVRQAAAQRLPGGSGQLRRL